MQAKTQTLFTRTIYGDFMRFAVASLVVGVVAAMLLSSRRCLPCPALRQQALNPRAAQRR